jgi:hypothetical protein
MSLFRTVIRVRMTDHKNNEDIKEEMIISYMNSTQRNGTTNCYFFFFCIIYNNFILNFIGSA